MKIRRNVNFIDTMKIIREFNRILTILVMIRIVFATMTFQKIPS